MRVYVDARECVIDLMAYWTSHFLHEHRRFDQVTRFTAYNQEN
jgi:hypothetical protein